MTKLGLFLRLPLENGAEKAVNLFGHIRGLPGEVLESLMIMNHKMRGLDSCKMKGRIERRAPAEVCEKKARQYDEQEGGTQGRESGRS